MDIFGNESQAAPVVPFKEQSSKIAVEGFVDENLRIDFEMDPAKGEERHITAHFSNLSGSDITGVNMLVAIQKNMKVALQPATGSILNGDKSNSVQQEMKVTNPFEGTKPIVIKIKVGYSCHGKQVNETKTVTFPLN